MLFGIGVVDRTYNYVYGNYGWLGVMFALMGAAVGAMMTYVVVDRRR